MNQFTVIILIFSIISTALFAQNDDEPLYDDFIKNLKKDYFTMEMLIQVVADFQPERTFDGYNGFSIANMRLKLSGKLDKKFGYFFQVNFAGTSKLLDASIKYKFAKFFNINAGQFKAPFSKEYLTSASNIDFVNRFRVTELLTPKRQIGFQFSGKFADDLIEYKAGIFNGNGPNKFSNNNTYMYVGRVSVMKRFLKYYFEFGFNAAYESDYSQEISAKKFNGKKTMLGGDVRIEIDKFMVSSEYIMNRFNGTVDTILTTRNPFGYHITAGYHICNNHQILFRFDNLSADGGYGNSKFYIIGYNYWATSATEIQFNYVIDSNQSDIKYNEVLINLQISL